MRTEDGYIIRKCLDGDPAAFGLLVEKYKEGLYALAYSKIGDFHQAQDIAQEAFIKAYKKLHTLKRQDSFHVWLYVITSNLCKDWIRSKSKRPDAELIEDQEPEILDQPSLTTYREGLVRESLREALDSLPEIHRQVLSLYYLGGLSVKEIAKFLGTSPDTIDKRLIRARLKLKQEMLIMMSATCEQMKLRSGFTLHLVEIVKQLRVHPHPFSRAPWLPWGLSLATGTILTLLGFMSFIPHLISFNPLASATSTEAKVLKVGELPVDMVKVSEMLVLSEGKEGKEGKESRVDWRIASISPNFRDALVFISIPQGAAEEEKYGEAKDNYEIYLTNIDGSNPIWLTNNSAGDGPSSWSPDGTKIAFTSNRDGDYEIFVMNADGSNPTQLTFNRSYGFSISYDSNPTWSPDGTKIAFETDRHRHAKLDGNMEIYVMNADGSTQTRLTFNSASDNLPSWSPDGIKIAFQSNRDGNNEIYVMNTDGSNPVNLTKHASDDKSLSWSSDGTKIAFESDRNGNSEIYVMDADGSNPVNLTNRLAMHPSWSSFRKWKK